MEKASNLIKIGSTVEIDLSKVEDRLPKELNATLRKDSKGKLVDYKMTDGQGIGVILEISDGSINWFFPEEIKQQVAFELTQEKNNEGGFDQKYTKNEFSVYSSKTKTDEEHKIIYLLNPLNFVEWLRYSTKDIF